jgi:hypothetical protein
LFSAALPLCVEFFHHHAIPLRSFLASLAFLAVKSACTTPETGAAHARPRLILPDIFARLGMMRPWRGFVYLDLLVIIDDWLNRYRL